MTAGERRRSTRPPSLDARFFEAEVFAQAVAKAPSLDMKMTVGLSRVEEEVQRVRAEVARRGEAVRQRASEMASLAVATSVLHDRLAGLLGSSGGLEGEEDGDGDACPSLTEWYTARVEPSLDEFSGLYRSLAREGFDRQLFRRCLEEVDAGRPPIATPTPSAPAPQSADWAVAERLARKERELLVLPPCGPVDATLFSSECRSPDSSAARGMGHAEQEDGDEGVGPSDEDEWGGHRSHHLCSPASSSSSSRMGAVTSPRLLQLLGGSPQAGGGALPPSRVEAGHHYHRVPVQHGGHSGKAPAAGRAAGGAAAGGLVLAPSDAAPVREMSYKQFLDRLLRPDSAELLGYTRRFIASVLGPSGDGSSLACRHRPRPPSGRGAMSSLSGAGGKDLKTRCAEFMGSMEQTLRLHPAWRRDMGLGHVRAISIRNALEKYVMTRIGKIAFKSQVNEAMDRKLEQRMLALAFLEPSALEIKPALQHALVLSVAQEELRRLDRHVAPGDKLDCVVRAAEAVFSALEHARSLETDMDSFEARVVTTDDFLPVFILVVLRAQVPRLFSTCEYIHSYHNPADMLGRPGCCFAHLQSAVQFLMTVEASMLNIEDKDGFTARLLAQTDSQERSEGEQTSN